MLVLLAFYLVAFGLGFWCGFRVIGPWIINRFL